MESKKTMMEICGLLYQKNGADIIAINIADQTIVADYFVLCSAKSNTAVKALADHLQEHMEKIEMAPIRKEGYSEGRWCAIDFGDIIVHIFYEETRRMYCLEKLWGNQENVFDYTAFKDAEIDAERQKAAQKSKKTAAKASEKPARKTVKKTAGDGEKSAKAATKTKSAKDTATKPAASKPKATASKKTVKPKE